MRTDSLPAAPPTALPTATHSALNNTAPHTTAPLNQAGRAQATQAADSEKPVDQAALQQSVATLNQFIQPHEGSIEFSIDEDSGKTLLKIVDKETDTVLMQFPSKDALALAKTLGKTAGMLIRDSA